MNKIDYSSFESAVEAADLPTELVAPSAAAVTEVGVISLFAGIGGFDLAFERVGADILMQCELDKFCQSVLRRHWPKAKLAADITKLDPETMPDADVWTAGFPCQDVSLARGNHGRNGLRGAHTSLFFKLMELVEVKKPKVILLENVVGLLNSHRGCDFAVILNELTSRGYAVAWRVLNARYFGAPQSRSRVFLCAWRGDYISAVGTLFEGIASAKPGPERTGFVTQTKDSRTGAIVPEVAYCVAATSGRHTGNDWSRSYISYADRVRRPTPTESERLQGFPTDWTLPEATFPEPGRGLDSERYHAVGNAVAVPVVTWIAGRIIAGLSTKTKASKLDFAAYVRKAAPDLNRESRLVDFLEVLKGVDAGNYSYRWKSGGCAWGHVVVEGAASPAPVKVIPSRFVDVLDATVPHDRYFLTPNAAAGIVRRADSVGRTLFPPMRKALDKIAATIEKPGVHSPRNEGAKEWPAQLSSA
ncbi:DNA cytosine methyltransferase [Aquibium microcysteis]|uniref:DNA cytosine methyltransferase n=1 Tax=Aquibium microcysteis TaxID=675281 RepID=UPI00165D0AC5|nr:DNA cytosine methyltransferase [Aquibium microcysteis]